MATVNNDFYLFRWFLFGVVSLTPFPMHVVRGASPSFHGLGMLPDGHYSYAYAVSGDGRVVVGQSHGADNRRHAVAWIDGVISPLSPIGSGTFLESAAQDLSYDGSVIVGYVRTQQGLNGAMWSPDGGGVELGGLGGTPVQTSGSGVSADGLTIVGQSNRIGGGWGAFRRSGGVMMDLGNFAGAVPRTGSLALDVSGDGATVVGFADSPKNNGELEAFAWLDGTMNLLSDLPGGDRQSRAWAVSSNGAVIVGGSSSTGSGAVFEAALWQESKVLGLGDLDGGTFESRALAVSDDGQFVVGVGRTSEGEEAFLWTAQDSMRRLEDVLTKDYGLDLEGWILNWATGISADGRIMVGYGIDPYNRPQAWVASVPEPGTLFLTIWGALFFIRGPLGLRGQSRSKTSPPQPNDRERQRSEFEIR